MSPALNIGQNERRPQTPDGPRSGQAPGRRHAARDRCLILLMFRHGLRVSEAVGLKLADVDMEGRSLHVARLKRGLSTTHPLRGDELRALRAWLTERAHETEDQGAVCQ